MKMLEPIFSEDEMQYCSVPVPNIDAHKDPDFTFDFTQAQIDNYGQSQVHPSIIYIPNGWNGHKYWLATTPYPNEKGVFENACIYYADEGVNGEPPVVFTPISGGTPSTDYPVVTNPVVKVQSNSMINSDPDLYFDETNQIMYLISRYNSSVPQRTFMQKSADGLSWSKRGYDADYIEGVGQPSIMKVGNEIILYDLKVADQKYEINPSSTVVLNASSRGLFVIHKGDPTQGITSFVKEKYAALNGKLAIGPYHADFFKDDATGKYYMIAACTDHELPSPYDRGSRYTIFLAESDDGYTYRIFSRPLLAPCSKCSNYYRPTAFVRQSDRTLVVYWSTFAGIIKEASEFPNGASDIPIDNRTIGLSYGNFDAILYKLKNDNITNIVE